MCTKSLNTNGVCVFDGRTMHEVWQTVLEETDRVGKVRLLAADTYMLQISEACKPVRSAKAQIAKKVGLTYLLKYIF